MTVDLNPVRVFSTGTGAETAFDFGFKYINASDVYVELDGEAVQESDYTITRNPSGDGGTVTFNTAPALDVEILIYHDVAATQETVIPYADKIPKSTLENAFDKLTLLVQQAEDAISRCVKVAYNQDVTPITDITLAANKAVIINADGDGFTLSDDDFNDQLADVTEQADNAAASASAAATSASAASTSASNAAASASAASTSASNAATSETNAAASVAAVSNKASCYAATTGALTATYSNGASGVGATLTNSGALAAFSVDGVSPSSGARILVKNQASSLQNGIYTLTTVGSGAVAWVLTRATDYDTSAEIVEGTFVIVEAGTVNTGAIYVMTTTGSVTVGTTGIVWAGQSIASPASVTDVLTGTSTTTQVTPDALAAIWEQGSDIASAGTLSIPSTGGGYFNITGTTTITKIDQATAPKTGREVILKFADALTFTHNSNILLPGSASITTAAGDVAMMRCEDTTSSNQIWRCIGYMLANGKPIATDTASTSTAGYVQLADAATMETATSTTTAVCPGNQHFHPGHPKSWVFLTTSGGTPTVTTSYGVTSVTDNGVGNFTINMSVTFSSANYCVVTGLNRANSATVGMVNVYSLATTNYRLSITDSVGAVIDPTSVQAVCMGDF